MHNNIDDNSKMMGINQADTLGINYQDLLLALEIMQQQLFTSDARVRNLTQENHKLNNNAEKTAKKAIITKEGLAKLNRVLTEHKEKNQELETKYKNLEDQNKNLEQKVSDLESKLAQQVSDLEPENQKLNHKCSTADKAVQSVINDKEIDQSSEDTAPQPEQRPDRDAVDNNPNCKKATHSEKPDFQLKDIATPQAQKGRHC